MGRDLLIKISCLSSLFEDLLDFKVLSHCMLLSETYSTPSFLLFISNNMDFTSNDMDPGKYHRFMPQNLPGLSPDASSWTVVALVLAGVLCFFMRLRLPKHDPQEPVLIPQAIPYIGHVLGIIKHGFGYYKLIQ